MLSFSTGSLCKLPISQQSDWPPLCTFHPCMHEHLGALPPPHTLAPPGPSIPQEWSETFLLEMSRQLRGRLIGECAELRTSDQRRDWLLHMALQAHQLPTLLTLITDFNEAQQSSPGEGFECLDLRLHEAGFLLKRAPLKRP